MTSSAENRGTPPGVTPDWKVGELEPFFETGTEGVIWSLCEDGKVGYESLHQFEDGDTLQIWESFSGRQVFYGKVKYDWKIGARLLTDFHPTAVKGLKQQCSLGLWVHGIQEGFDPDEWGRLFMRPEGAPDLRAAVLPRGKRGKVEDKGAAWKPTKASPTRFRSKRASKMARSAGKSRSVSGRRGSGRSSKP